MSIVNWTLAVPVTAFLLREAVTPVAAPITVVVRATVPLKPVAEVTVSVLVLLLPAFMGPLDGDAARLKPVAAADGGGMSSMPARVSLQSQL